MRRSGLAIVAVIAIATVAAILAALGVFSTNEESTGSPRAPDQAETTDPGGEAETAVATEATGDDASSGTDGDSGNESSATQAIADGASSTGEQESVAGDVAGGDGATAGDGGSAAVEGAPARDETSATARDEAAAGDVAGGAGEATVADDGSAPVEGAPARDESSATARDEAAADDASGGAGVGTAADGGSGAAERAPGDDTSATARDETAAHDETGEQAAGGGSSETAEGRAAAEEPAPPAEGRDAGSGASSASVADEPERDLPAIEPTGQMPAPEASGAASETPAPAQPEPDPELQREAESFVSELSEPSREPLAVDELDTFVTGDRPLSPAPEGVGADAPDGPQPRDGPGQSATRESRQAAVSGAVDEAGERNRQQAGAGTAQPPAVTPQAQREAVEQPVVELPLSEQAPVTIAELLGAEEVIPSNAVFYVHTVQPEDNQGIWGIIHDGIVDNFAEGVAMRRGGESETYRIDIPRHADERQADRSSSFLGQLIYEKSRRSYVYNYQTNRVGKNPDLIVPGQEIVIVSFTPEELIAIYKHFVQSQEN